MSYTRKMNDYVVYMDTERTALNDRNAPIMQIAMIWVKTDTNEIVNKWESPLPVPANPIISEPGQKHLNKVIRTCKSALPMEHIVRTFLTMARGPEDRQPPEIRGWNFVVYANDEKDRQRADNDEFNTIIHQFGLEDEWIGSWKDKKRVKDVAIGKAWNYWRGDNGGVKRELCNVAFSLGIDVDEKQLHSPLYDCILTAQVDAALDALEENGKPIPELKDFYASRHGEPVKKQVTEDGETPYIMKMKTPKPQQKEFDLGDDGKADDSAKAPVKNTDAIQLLEAHENRPRPKVKYEITYEQAKKMFDDKLAGHGVVVKCPFCKDSNMVLMRSKNVKAEAKGTVDEFFFQCQNDQHKNNGKVMRGGYVEDGMSEDAFPFTMNVDGTKFQKHAEIKMDDGSIYDIKENIVSGVYPA